MYLLIWSLSIYEENLKEEIEQINMVILLHLKYQMKQTVSGKEMKILKK